LSDSKEKLQPGIDAYIGADGKGFSKIQMLLDATGGLSLSQVCAVTGLEGSTIQNWVKRGWVEHPKGKRYEEVHIARILIINALKECIKLEHISLLMSFVRGNDKIENSVKESVLFNYLCQALGVMGKSSGVEAAVDEVLKDYKGSSLQAETRLRKALSLMMYACVCTDVKRRTETMMKQILHEIDNPLVHVPEPVVTKQEAIIEDVKLAEERKIAQERRIAEDIKVAEERKTAEEIKLDEEIKAIKEIIRDEVVEEVVVPDEDEVQEEITPPEMRKTIAQTLREWDVSSVERIIIEHDADSGASPIEEAARAVNRPWFSRKPK